MKPQFKTAIVLTLGIACVLFAIYFDQFDVVTELLSEVTKGGTYGLPPS